MSYIERETILKYSRAMLDLAEQRIQSGQTEDDVWKAIHHTHREERAEFVSLLENAPAADVAPVRHGQWLPQIVLGEKAWDCSECKTLGSPHWKWCPMCGCRMDVKEAPTCHDGVCEIPGVEQEESDHE